MDTSNIIQKHSKEKLAVFESYLINYLSVMSNIKFFKTIYIWDVFAGIGKDENNNNGSAIIAANIITDFRKKHKKNIILIANELNEDNFEKLKTNLSKYSNKYIVCRNYLANKLIGKINKAEIKDCHHMFFIDPYGYTQCDSEKLLRLLSMKNADHLIFMPINHIYRFVNQENNSAKKFVQNLGVDIDNNINDKCDLIERIEIALRNNISNSYVYSYEINKNKYALFFISKHKLGAQKFLEAAKKIKNDLDKQNIVFNFKKIELKDKLLPFLKNQKTNRKIYDFCLKKGFLSQEINSVLKELKKSNKLIIDPPESRGFYLTNKNKTINIKLLS